MKPAPFEYLAPESVAEAVAALSEYGFDAKLLAGGQSLVPVMAMRLSRFDYLIDLNRTAGLDFIEVAAGTDGGTADNVVIGAMTREARVGSDPTIARAVPLLHEATKLIGHFQIRNRGTLGGSIAHADPAAEYPAVALALDASMNITGPGGTRTVPAADFFFGPMMNSLEEDELLESVNFPVWGDDSRWSIREFARRAGDFATAGVATGVQLSAGDPDIAVIEKVAIAFFGMGSVPTRPRELETSLIGRRVSELDLAEIGRQAVEDLEPPSDIHASSAFRLRVGADLVRQTLVNCLEPQS
ncbi:FAD binding domain-containing protein [Jatrophihabitans sp. DSM 45814]